MIDKYIIKFCGIIDNSFSWLDNLFAPKCKCKRKKKNEKNT